MKISPSDFLGSWRIERTIVDTLAGKNAKFRGTASISSKYEDWVYAETGTLEFGDSPPMQAGRQYYWQPDNSGFDIFFDDKRFFHRFNLGQNMQARHWCDPDQYEVLYDLAKWPEWKSTWSVTGPRKGYVMTSTYIFER